MFAPVAYLRAFRDGLMFVLLDGKFWQVNPNVSLGDTAYTNVALGAHTDNTYFVRRLQTYLSTASMRLSDPSDIPDRPFRASALPPPLTHGRVGRQDAPS